MTFPSEENHQPNGKSSSDSRTSDSQNLPGTSGLCRDILPSQTVSGPYKNNHMHYSGYNAYGNQYTAYQNGWYYNNRSYNQGYKMHRGWPYHNRAKGPEAVRTIYLFTYTTEHLRALLSKINLECSTFPHQNCS